MITSFIKELKVLKIDQRALASWRILICTTTLFLAPTNLESLKFLLEANPNFFEYNFLGFILFRDIPSLDTYNLNLTALQLTLFLSSIGLFTKIALFTSGILILYICGISYGFGGWNHEGLLLSLPFLSLTLSKCNEHYSLDTFFFKSPKSEDYESKDTIWPILVVRISICILFFFAGLKKLEHTGLDWIFSDNLSNILRVMHNPEYKNILLWVAENTFLCQILAGVIVLFELSTPLMLFLKGVGRTIFVVSQVIFLISMGLILREMFILMYPLLLCWLPWEKFNGYRLLIHKFFRSIQLDSRS